MLNKFSLKKSPTYNKIIVMLRELIREIKALTVIDMILDYTGFWFLCGLLCTPKVIIRWP
jgi:hypothetical protein